jgi:hypothetical protein
LAEWLYEEGIGENRAILVEAGEIVEAVMELPDGLKSGAVVAARIASIPIPGRRAIAVAAGGEEILVEPFPRHVTEGAAVRVEIVRESLAEHGLVKRAKGRITDAPEGAGPSLFDRLGALGIATLLRGPGPDRFEQAGWTELLEEAATGEVPFDGGSLRMSLTPTMTLFDVDGSIDPAALAIAGAAAAGRTVRRFGIGGSIGIDLPTLPSKEDRQKAAAALDAALPQPFERTAVNGFGFLQLVRRRERASIPEMVQFDPVGAAARALLRRAEHGGGHGERTIEAHPLILARIEAEPSWLETLTRRLGASIALRANPALAISAGHVHSQHH